MKVALENSYAELHGLCAPLTAEQAHRKPAPDAWSVAEVIEHLTMAETGTYLGIQRRLNQPAATTEEVAATTPMTTIITEKLVVVERKLQAPEAVRPSGRYGEWPAPLAAFEKIRKRVLTLAETDAPEFDTHVFPHPVLGPMTIRQWLLFINAHTRRHLPQLRACISC